MSKELLDFLKRSEDKSTLSQIILPFCSNTSGERNPVALLTGNVNLKTNLRKDGKPVSYEQEMAKLEAEIANLKATKGEVVDLSAEIKRLQIETNQSDEKEVEIKEEWSVENELLYRTRKERKMTINTPVPTIEQEQKKLSSDIEELLRLAEMEEEEETGKMVSAPSKVKEIKKEVIEQNVKASGKAKELPKLKLPKITASNPLVGDIVERESEPIRTNAADEVSSRIILNDLKKLDLKSTTLSNENEEAIHVETKDLKKPSRFSFRKQQ